MERTPSSNWKVKDRAGGGAAGRPPGGLGSLGPPGVGACHWPPDHRLVAFTTADLSPAPTDDCAAAPRRELAGAVSDQPADAAGDGSTAGDVQLGPGELPPTAERSGRDGTRTHEGSGVPRDECGCASVPAGVALVLVLHDPAETSMLCP